MKPKVQISKDIAINAIKKKLVGKSLTYEEIFAIMDQIGNERLGPILTTYFAAAGFKEGFSNEELYFLTKAMVETGPKLKFRGIVAGKHSMGGVAGTRTTMIVVPIIAAAGYRIPKNSTRAITSPAGTADAMEVLAPVTFTPKQIKSLVEKTGGCIVWGGYLGFAPADDVIIQIEQPLAFESYDKVIVSILAKQIASGVNHLIIDIPVGMTMKIQHFKDGENIAEKFRMLGKRFGIHVITEVSEIRQNAGRGVGPVLEARDVLSVLEQQPDRPQALESRALRLAGKLLNLCYSSSSRDKYADGEELARDLLTSGKALSKFQEIIKAQGGDPKTTSSGLKPGEHHYHLKSTKRGIVGQIDNQQISSICRILGCPSDKKAGMYLHHKLEDRIEKDDILCTLYATDEWKLKEAIDTLDHISIYKIQ